MRLLVVLLAVLFATPVLAQTSDRVSYLKNTILDFNGHVVEGVVEGPEVIQIGVRKQSRFDAIIQIRESFRGELLGSAADL